MRLAGIGGGGAGPPGETSSRGWSPREVDIQVVVRFETWGKMNSPEQ